jgi:hypothetical protein
VVAVLLLAGCSGGPVRIDQYAGASARVGDRGVAPRVDGVSFWQNGMPPEDTRDRPVAQVVRYI